MGDEAKSRSARRILFPAPTPTPPSSPPPALMKFPQVMDGGKPAQQPRAGDPSPGIAKLNGGVQQEEEEEQEQEKALANDGVQEEDETTLANDGVQEEKALKTDLPASGPESAPQDVAAGEKKMGKGAAVRVWSVQDEVRILECLAAFVQANGAPPARSQLHGVVHGHVLDKKEFTVTEIYEKVRRLRDRYYARRTKAAAAAAAAAGAPPPGDTDEELRKYELSGQIWDASLPLLPKREIKEENGTSQARVRRKFEELRNMYPHLTLLVEEIAAADRGFLKMAFEFIDDSKARQLDAKVKKQRILEIKTERDRSSAQREVLSTLMEYMA